MTIRTAALGALLACSTVSHDSQGRQEPPELGRVGFSRDFEASLARARSEDRPLFVLFQEVPGCATCVAFGEGPLSHPLLVEAIEGLFVPVAVYNNAGGADRNVLERYSEPAWNNPVVRFLDADGSDLIARRDAVWSTPGIALRADAALRAAGVERPQWFRLLVTEMEPHATRTAVFAMPCFWTGEARLGRLEGVVGTRPGWYSGREVVEVTYRPDLVAWPALLREAESASCAAGVWVPDPEATGRGVPRLEGAVHDAQASDRLYHLGHSPLRWLPLTPLQAMRVNAALAGGDEIEPWLSPRQRAMAQRIEQLGTRAPERLSGLERPTRHEELARYARDVERVLGR